MRVLDAIRTVLAVRDYKPDPIPDDALMQILEAARLTGSSKNRQAWQFIVIRDRSTLAKLAPLCITGAYLNKAAAAIAVLVPHGWPGTFDAGRAMQSMILTAWELGIGSNVVTNTDIPEIHQLLGVPADLMVLGFLPLGYPVKKLGMGRKVRKPLAEMTHSERFGAPLG